MAPSRTGRARSMRHAALLHQAVLARTPAGWIHGQVVEVNGASVMVQTGDTPPVACRAASATTIDPVTALLLERCTFGADTPLGDITAIHSSILSRLIGEVGPPRQAPTRDIVRILDRLVEPDEVPTGDRRCSWVNPDDSTVHNFTLQHAVDFVFMHQSTATRIARKIRDSVGVAFFAPPAQQPPSVSSRPSYPVAALDVEPVPSRGTKRRASDSFYDSASDDDAERAANGPAEDIAGRHARIVALLADTPDLLDHYLTVQSRSPPSTQRRAEQPDCDVDADQKPSKFQFRPTANQERVHRITMASRPPGTSAHDFLDSLIAHRSVQFAPHPGTLMRLYDFQFGTRGLSIMHIQWLKQLDKIHWVLSSGTNMQNFSANVAVPAASEPTCIEDIITALSTLRNYCAAFAAPGTIEFAQALLTFSQQLVGIEIWSPEDLKYLVYWINGRLEEFRQCAARDATAGGESRLRVQDSISQTHPEFQVMLQLITTRKVSQALEAARASHSTNPQSTYGPSDRPTRANEFSRGSRRVGEQGASRGGTRVPPEVLNLLPRQGSRSLCLRSLSAVGCSGARGNAAECFDPHRAHFIPASLPKLVRDFIQQQYVGLRTDAQHL